METSLFGWKLFPVLDYICKQNVLVSKGLSKYLHKQIWNPKDREELLETLGDLFIQLKDAQFGTLLRPVLLDIVMRGRVKIEKDELLVKSHSDFCIALSHCLHWPDIQRFTLEYVQGKPSFTKPDESTNSEPKKKKAKKSKVPEEAICHAAWLFTHYLGDAVTNVIPLEEMLPYLSHDDDDVRWFACQTIMEHQKMMSSSRNTFLCKYFTEQKCRKLKTRHSLSKEVDISLDGPMCVPERASRETHTRHMILETDLCDGVTCVGGVVLTKTAGSSDVVCLDLLPVPSNETNLHSLALAVSSGSPVLLQGVVGSGKTTLVEHLARLSGRAGPPQLMKIQLGDQMDSKALLGTYRCTEVPGEFIWQPGVLTQAVTRGYWVLLEDIDYAPMEVISVLLPLLETRTLSIPGHGDTIRAAPGFHLFATQRLVSSSSGWQRQQTGTSMLLDKLWTTVLVEPLSRAELSQVLCTKYPPLETVIEKLLDIYFLLSAGDHHQGALDVTMETDADSVGKFLSRDGRLISTRDLMTWCGRIARNFDISSTATANLVFQEAVDCFVACLSKSNKRMPLAEAIGVKLNITNVKAEYFCLKYKPDVSVSPKAFTVGRVTLPVKEMQPSLLSRKMRSTFSYTRQSCVLLERVAVCVSNREPVLLVGETGTGKTSSVQYLAQQLGHTLHVINMNQQSDSADLLGGFKPVDLRHIIKPFYEDFELLFCKSFSRKQNLKFMGHLQECFGKRKWDTMFSLMDHTTTSALQKFDKESKKQKRWQTISRRLAQLKIQVQQTQNALAFSFMEGSLVKAIRAGHWVLLDEINLAAMETLECLSGLLESTTGSVLLMERGDIEPVVRHPDFRLFACMNPATDVGKKDLSPGIRNRFTELFVDELEDTQDLKILVSDYLQGLSLTASQLDGIVKFYLIIRNEAMKKLTDGTGHQPHYSLRTLCRALMFSAANTCGSVARSLYEGFCLSFLTQLDRVSHPVVVQLVSQHVIGKSNMKSILKQALPAPPGGKCLSFEGFWISTGDLEPHTAVDYILTQSVRANLRDLSRVVSAGQHPVLIQGETSVGKTSLIKWLAQSSGNTCVRVNNHEHTDLQEYVGCYAADEDGKLVFKEGVLVEAMKKGHWIILDELNLAPTDVLEALNRLLDDNRELYISETQETVKAHPKFMLFATQNPPGHYGGRKMLSRAFRNRFVELHFDEIPSKELETILHERCRIPLSYSKRLIAVMLELQTRRRGSGVFAGKMGFMTLRDLFRWAERYNCPEMDGKKFYDWDKHLADQGYMLLAGRVRKVEEVGVIQEVIQKHFKCKISIDSLFTLDKHTSMTTKSTLENVLGQSIEDFQHVVWTHSMRRLAVLIGQAVRYKEPILLVGETGCGKTTMCQMYAAMYQTTLHSLNCHLHTESADFLGGLRPVRAHSEEDKKDKLFEWVDGPLVLAMKGGAMFLIDEISLADDSVLERLNSVLEPERTILLAEKGGGDGGQNEVEQVVAKDGFHVFATMNPGGDFGKKELSPALRNRFTEIWCPPSNQRQDLIDIIEHNLHSGIHLCNQEDGTSGIGRAMMDFVQWFTNNELGKRCTVSIRDILSWVRFINTCSTTQSHDLTIDTEHTAYNQLDPAVAYIHGACLVFLDGLGAGSTSRGNADNVVNRLRAACLAYLLRQVNSLTHQEYKMADLYLLDNSHVTKHIVLETDDQFCIPPFSISKGTKVTHGKANYALEAPGTCVNAQRLLRALQLPRPLLLEGSPGVGKTSLVGAIARASGRELVRINLSEQTDVTDLFGADLPVEGAEGGVFAWRDGPLLQALKAGSWIVLDELNLASQSVLEGLNACLDHRAEVYVPELGKTFHIQHEKTRMFACQNPLNQGGGRKGLPRSFLNRFTQVYVEPLCEADLMFIAGIMYPDIPAETLTYMIKFNMQIHEETVVQGLWGQRGSPWEFNLRDLFRWCDLLLQNQASDSLNPGEYMSLVYADRMRTTSDKQQVFRLYERLFPAKMEAYRSTGIFHYGTQTLQFGHSFLKVGSQGHIQGDRQVAMEILHHNLEPMESLMKCVEMNWMTILVGPPSSGKSSIVEMLSQLTGHQLNVLAMNSAMDTTELLGGFEQADTSRHIEGIATDVGDIIQLLCQRCLLHNDTDVTDTVAKLQIMWRQYTQYEHSGDQTSNVEELDMMKKQVSALLAAIVYCKKIGEKMVCDKENMKTIARLRKRLNSLSDKLSLAEPGKGGGAFEWVDSLLVKSLKLGHWLLIDNVNFCSASVLDRLNALLEPNGVLSINERGVIDGEIPTIKPHPNFRLFLSMDPKRGEISRAMRNRGVEIYMAGEDDGKPFSESDLRRIFISLGLTSKPAFDWLQRLHNHLKEELPRGDKPGIQHMLQVGQNVVQHCNHGYSLEKSVWTSCYSVYVQRQRHAQSKQLSLTILTERFQRWADEVDSSVMGPEMGISPIKLPGVSEYTQDPGCAAVLRNAAVFASLLDMRLKRSNDLENIDLRLKHSLSLILNLTSADDINQTVDWLQYYCADKTKKQSVDMCNLLVDSLHDVCKHVVVTMATLGYKDTMKQLSLETSDQPVDMRWNPQLLDRCLLTTDEELKSQIVPQLDTTFNRLHTQQLFQVEMCLIKKHFLHLQEALQRDKERGKQTLHPAIGHLVVLYPILSAAITDAISHMALSTYSDVLQVLEGFSWIRRLFEVASATLSTDEAASQLCLFWKWFHSKTLPVCLGDGRDHQKLSTVISVVQGILGKDDKRWKVFVKFWRSLGHPSPFRNKIEADYCVSTLELHRMLDLGKSGSGILDKAKVKVIVSSRQFLISTFKFLLSHYGTEDLEMKDKMDDLLSALRVLLRHHSLCTQHDFDQLMDTDDQSVINQPDSSVKETSLPIEHVQLWPLFEHSSGIEGWRMLERICTGQFTEENLSVFSDFAAQFTPIEAADLNLFQNLSNATSKDQLPSVISSVLLRLRKSTVVNCPTKWLEWKEDVTAEEEQPSYEQKSFHQSALSTAVFSLLSRADDSLTMTTPANVKLNAPLKSYQRELTQLSHVSRHVWAHVTTYSSAQRQTQALDKSSFFSTLYYILLCLKPLINQDHIPEFSRILETFSTCEPSSLSPQSVDNLGQVLSEGLSALDDDMLTLMTHCIDSVRDVVQDTTCDLSLLGVAWISLGLMGMNLLAPKGPVDPIEKMAIKLKLLNEELVTTETELEVLCMYHRLVTGQELTDVSLRLVHPRIPHLVARTREITLQIEELTSLVAYRPTPSQYNQLVTDIQNYITSVASLENVHKLITKQQTTLKRTNPSRAFLQEVELWEISQDKFVAMLQSEYPLYRDVTTPFICAVNQMVHGMHVMFHTVKQHLSLCRLVKGLPGSHSNKEIRLSLENIILTVGKFPTVSLQQPTCLHLATTLTSDPSLSLMKNVLIGCNVEEGDLGSTVSERVLNSCLHHIENEARTRGRLTSDLIASLTHILEMFVMSWQQEEQKRRDKEEMDKSLYRFKSQVHGDERSEDEVLETEFWENFPQFQKDFLDLVEPTSLEDTTVDQAVTADDNAQPSALQVSETQMTLIFSVHQQLYKHLVITDWYQPISAESMSLADWIKPVLSSYSAASTLTKCLSDILSSGVDSKLLGGHLVVSAVQQYYILQDSQKEKSPLLAEMKVYDIYHDSNVPEVIHCLPVLHNLTARVHELQQEWPDHPTLKQLCEIVERIQSFPITAPVIKFLTGIELLLQKAQDWESNASQHVSMVTQLSEMSQLIVQWRKLELSCWTSVLDNEAYRYRTSASKWWFHLYELIQSALQPQESDKPSTMEDIIKTLKQFVEQSSLGDYHVRLQMLLSFHCQLATMATTDHQTFLMRLLWNLFQFYSRFAVVVQTELDRLRKPIEKELKGFVKIARWSDVNYWALKQATEKTHRTLHKHIKQFQVVLHQPVQGILGDKDSAATSSSGADHSTWANSLKHYQENVTKSLNNYKVSEPDSLPAVLIPHQESIPLQCRLSHLCVRYNRHWTQVVSTSNYSQHLVTLDTFIGDVIEEIHELQSLEINRSVEKEKQKAEAKHQNQRKRKALSDLFRYLTKLGISYRKGLTISDTGSDAALLVPPLDLAVSPDSDESIQGVWEGCLQYYYKCISGKALLTTALLVPSKELGIGNLERCRGFAEHLYKLLVDQYETVATRSSQYRQIQSVISDIDRLVKEKPTILPQEEATNWMTWSKDLVLQLLEGLNQFLVVLHSCPRQQGEITLHPSPCHMSDLHKMALIKQGDEILTDTIGQIKDMLSEVQISQKMLDMKQTTLLLWSDVLNIQTVFEKLSSMVPKMQEICKLFCDLGNPEHPNAFTEVLHFMCSEISEKSHDFNSWFMIGAEANQIESDLNVVGAAQFSQQMEMLVSNILMVVQKLSKHHAAVDTEVAEADGETSEDVEDELQDGHLTSLVLDKLHKDGEMVDCTNIIDVLTSLVQEIVRERDQSTRVTLTCILHRCVPLVYQYRDILHHHLVSNIATERLTGKLLSVLLGVFTELTTKGFCIPPELADELEGEGATDFCDIEEGGLGEGEGVKNVSDQIEDEDQLDDAKRPEDRKEEDKSNEPDIKSEENAIEMSEDFDGKTQDLEDADKQEQDEDDDDAGDDELDKQMGDVDEQEEDKLDEQMWGSDEEEEGDSKEEEKEESGPGDGKQSEPELVAKDDNEDKTETEGNKDKGDNKDDTQEENNEEQKPNNLDQMDQDNYDDDQVDPYHGKDEEEKQAPEDMELPDDLNLDEDEAGKDEGEAEDVVEETAKEDETKLPPEETPEQTEEEQGDESEERKQEDATEQNAQEADVNEEGKNEEQKEEEEMETDTNERKEEEGNEDPGFSPQDEVTVENEAEKEDNDTPQAGEHHEQTSHDAESVEQSDTAQDQAGQDTENNQQEMDGTGQASSEQVEGHQGQKSTNSTDTSSDGKRKKHERQPGKSDMDRSLGSTEQKYKKLKTTDNTDITQDQQQEDAESKKSDTYEHIKDSTSHYDAQTLDVATADQQEKQDQIRPENEEADSDVDGDVDMADSDEDKEDTKDTDDLSSAKLKKKSKKERDMLEDDTADNAMETENAQKYELPGDQIATETVARGPDSTIHTALEHLYLENMTFDLESLRAELEDQLGSWNQDNLPSGTDNETAASDLWHRYEALTSSLSQDLCEQLRLVLEPTQATKLKGDYRTGKRLNMRKVIPYIASQFRKDKIWLRRTRPSKRQYQVMLAIDDSSSMVDNHSKQIAFESLALISNALTLLEAGQISICSFGETVNFLHPFTEQFTSQSGAHLLQYLTFEQKKTKIAQLLKHATSVMMDARQQQQGSLGNPETSQLLLMVSDGRGLFMEGMEVVKTAVRQAREANVFLVFVIIDNPVNKDSILDIKVPVFKQAGQIPEINSYMDSFPFPFYIILRDINSLPIVLSDALRQWFELVTAVDR